MVFCGYIRHSISMNIDISFVDLMSDAAFVFSSHESYTELSFAKEVYMISFAVIVLCMRDGFHGKELPAVVLDSHLQTSVRTVIKLRCNDSRIISLKTF